MTETLAALDIGTNSFHLVVARFGDGTTFEVVAREKEMVRLGSGSGDMKRIEDDAVDRGIEALERFRKVAEVHGADLYAVATSAVREAENAGTFLRRARDEAGVEVEVISGIEEARLIHLGVIQALPVYDRRIVLVDIGGGSTEILVGEQGDVLEATSLKLGALRLTRRYFADERLDPGAVAACRQHVRAALAPTVRDVQRVGFEQAVASSGTAEAVVAMVDASRDDAAAPRTFNGFEVTRKEVKGVVKALAGCSTVAERRKLPGVDESRADILLAGAIILEQVMGELGLEAFTFSDYALREGALLDALQRRRGATLHHLHDLRRRSVLHLAELLDEDPEHSSHVASLALQLFDATQRRHGADDDDRELLEAAALLANVGLFVAHSAHHKHSYYLIRNSEHLTGFTDHEIEVIAQVARYHRKSAPKASHAEHAALRPEDQDRVRTLAGLLRVAIPLDRTHAGQVVGLTARSEKAPKGAKGKGPIVVEVEGRHDADLSLELYSAEQRTGLLAEVLGRPVVLEVAGQPALADVGPPTGTPA